MDSSFVIMGLPASGKTTYLAALWHLIEAGEVECRIRLDKYEGDLEYLNSIAEAWRTFKKVPRTSQVGDQDVSIQFIDQHTKVRGTAFFPDLAGETFDTQVEGRKCKPRFVDDVASDDGVLFFISADRKEDQLSILDFNKMLPPAELDAGEADPGLEEPQEAEWDPKYIPAQVRIVQILSDLLRLPFVARPRRLAIVISAWDLTSGSGFTPTSWLEAHMPLLAQFLATNQASFEHALYGISAQGIRLEDEAAIDGVADLAPSRRVRVTSDAGESHDLTLPLAWLMTGS